MRENTDQKNSEHRNFSPSNNDDYSSKVFLILQARIVAGAASDKLSLLLSYKAKTPADVFSGECLFFYFFRLPL